MSSISDKRSNFKIEIRKKRLDERRTLMRANLFTEHYSKEQQTQFSDQKLTDLVSQTLSSRQQMLQNIQLIKSASYNISQKNVHLLFSLVKEFCCLIANIEGIFQMMNKDMKEHIQDSDTLYNDIVTVLINISFLEVYEWPVGDYLPIIKNLLIKTREINTMWLLSNILCQRTTPQTRQSLTKQLLKCDVIQFCEQRFLSKFTSEYDIVSFSGFVCAFLSNSEYLTFDEFKKVIKLLETLSDMTSESIDMNILKAMTDHAPQMAKMNYQLLYAGLIPQYKERYIKTKRTKMIIEFLDFVKTYVFCEIQQTLDQNGEQFIDEKVAKKNYQRISQHILPILGYLIENRAPSVNAYLMEICCMLLEFYFPFIDLENQDIFTTLAQQLNKSTASTLAKYSNPALTWQLRLIHIILTKVHLYKIQTDLLADFIGENQTLQAFANLLKDKRDVTEIINLVTEILTMVLDSIDKNTLFKHEKNQLHIDLIRQNLENILDTHAIPDNILHAKMEKLLNLCQEKLAMV